MIQSKKYRTLESAQREADIQTVLARIRRVALTMQTTEDIGPVVVETRDALMALGIKAYRTHIDLVDQDRDLLTVWGCKRGAKFSHLSGSLSEQRKAGSKWHATRPRGQRWQMMRWTKRQLIAQLKKAPKGFARPEEKQRAEAWVASELKNSPVPFYQYLFYFSGGQIGIGMDCELAKDEIAIVRRVTETFDFAYKRFVDLQDKEYRAREAEIEAALERVRARAQGMQESSEIKTIARILYDSYVQLGYEIDSVSIGILGSHGAGNHGRTGNRSRKARAGRSEGDSDALGSPILLHLWEADRLRLDDTEVEPRAFVPRAQNFSRLQAGEAFTAYAVPRKSWKAGFEKILAERGVPRSKIRERMRGIPKLVHNNLVPFSSGALSFRTGSAFEDEDFEIGRRFADVFGFAYKRFRDLQQKEEQNRELTIQNALERVRAKAQGMQESSEIKDVSTAVRDEFVGLGYQIDAVGIYIPDEAAGVFEVWFANPHTPEGTASGPSGFMRIDRRIRGVNAMLAGERFVVVRMDRDGFVGRIRKAHEGLGTPERDVQARIDAIPDTVYGNAVNFGPGCLHFTTAEPFTEDELAVAGRFADVFGGAYARFLELKEKEDQNRELTIQNAIERVRARALGMLESDDLVGVSHAVFDELKALGLSVALTSIGVRDEDSKDVYRISPSLDAGPTEWFTVTRDHWMSNPTLAEATASWDRGDPWFLGCLEGDEAVAFDLFWSNSGGVGSARTEITMAAIWFSRGWLYMDLAHPKDDSEGAEMIAADPLDDDQLAMAKRFADVFDFAYGRYLELKQKEDQNRELTIQNAIERVRARALGMQESSELSEIVTTMSDELNKLDSFREAQMLAGVTPSSTYTISGSIRTSISIWHEDDHFVDVWMRRPSGGGFRVVTADERRSPWGEAYLKARHAGERDFCYYVSREEAEQYLQYWHQRNVEAGHFPADRPVGTGSPWLTLCSFFNGGSVNVRMASEEPVDFSQDNKDVVARFTAAFEFAYNRFLELKEKEDQNRELSIQNALERVRARALGMQESREIVEVARLNYEEMSGLRYDIWLSGIFFYSVEGDYLDYYATQDSEVPDRLMDVAFFHTFCSAAEIMETQGRHRFIQTALETLERDGRQFSYQLEGDELQDYMADTLEHLFVDTDKEASLARIPNSVTYHRYFIDDPAGPSDALGAVDFTVRGEPLDDEGIAVGRRFADAFEFAYSRFRELKEKEDQNRELMVQNAIERVRSRALGMQESSELDEVSVALFGALDELGLGMFWSSIWLLDEEESTFTNAVQVAGAEELFQQVASVEEVIQDEHSRLTYEAFKRGEDDYQSEMVRQEFTTWLDFWVPIVQRQNPDYRVPKQIVSAEQVFQYGVFFRHGGMEIGRPEAVGDHERSVLKRLVEVFEFAYSRFLELKQKEDQNRELTIQNAIERVRSRALGMQESDELSAVATVLLNQVRGLGWDAHAAVVVVFDEATGDMEFWGTREDGLSYGRLEAPPPGSVRAEINDQMLAVRKAGASWFVIERDRDERSRWWREIYKATGLLDEEILERLRGISEHEVTHRVFYERGFLGFNLEERLSDDDLAVAKRLADAFGFAYSRFLELKEKEEQVRAADQRAAVDRVRAEAAAMEGTEDIANVVKALWEGLQGQNVDYDFLSMEVIDEDANLLQAYAAIPDGSPILSLLAMEAQQGARRERVEEKLLEGINLLRSEISLSDAIESGFSKADLSRTVLTDGGRDDRGEFLQKVWGLSPSADSRPSVKAVRAGFNHGSINLYTGIDVEIVDETVALVEALGDAVSLGFARYWDFRELEEQNRALEEANEEVREATRLKSQFLATMSHELRTPMNAIIGFTRLVLRRSDKLEDRQRGNLEKVQLSADHLLALINDILDLSKVEAGRVDVAPSTFNVPPLLEHCCATVGPTLGKAGVELVCEIEDAVGEAYTDESRLRQIVTNLLSNALKFTDTGEVRVVARILDSVDPAREAEVSGSGPYVEVAVSDTGIGIPENQREAVFEEFRQVDGSNTRRHQGTGLGLKITKQLIELLGGTIWLESELGKGSTFTFQIPVRYNNRAAVQESRGAEDMPGSGAEQQVTGDVRTIVSIDDDPNVAILLRQELETEGYTVISALTADEGVALVKKHQPAAVTVDILMPGKDGWQTIGSLKGDPETRDIPIVVLSAIENKSLGLAMGVRDYLIKPVDRDALLAMLGRVDNGSVKDVLVVDDEPSAADLLTQILSEEGLASRRAANGREAMDRIAERVPDAILLDLMMPEMNGFEVVAKLQEDPIWSTIPVIVVTAKDLESDERTYLAKHVEKVVQKGRLDPSGLAQAVRDAVGKNA